MIEIEIANLKEELIRRGQLLKVRQVEDNWSGNKEMTKGILEMILQDDNKKKFFEEGEIK